jgi:hypothetical protein
MERRIDVFLFGEKQVRLVTFFTQEIVQLRQNSFFTIDARLSVIVDVRNKDTLFSLPLQRPWEYRRYYDRL